MIRLYILTAFIFTLLVSQVSAQVIDLDEEQELTAPDFYNNSTMFYLSPIGTFGYQFGYRNMVGILNSSLDLNPILLSELTAFGVGWRNGSMFYNFHGAFTAFPQTTIQDSGPNRTVFNSSIYYAEFSMGRAVVSNDRFYLILRGGLGFFGSQFRIRQYDQTNFDFENFASGTGVVWPELVHASGTYDFSIEYMPRALRVLSVIQSAQFGYKGGIGSPTWRSPDARLVNPVPDRVSMIYLRASVVISKQN
jgi:hypothetical protein